MLKKIFTICLSLLSLTMMAQKIEINEDNQVLVGGQLFGIIESIGEGDAAVYSFINNADEELVTAEMSEDKKTLYKLVFAIDDDVQGYMTAAPNMRMALVKEIIKNKLVVNDILNVPNVKKYCLKTNVRAPKISLEEKEAMDEEKADAKAQAKEDAQNAKDEKKEDRAEEKEEKAEAKKDKKEIREEDAEAERTKSNDELLDEVLAAAAEKSKKYNGTQKPGTPNAAAEKTPTQQKDIVKDEQDAEEGVIETTDEKSTETDPFAQANKPVETKKNTAKKSSADSTKYQSSDVVLQLEKDKIIANGAFVGSYKTYNNTIEGKPGKTISFYSRDAKRLGAFKYQIGSNGGTLTTAKDGLQQILGFGVTEEHDILVDILTQLVELGYLK